VGQFHVAGHTDKGSYKLDTHVGPIISDVWDVYRMAVRRFGRVPTLIEWDEEVPEFDVLVAESALARKIEHEVLNGAERTGDDPTAVLGVHQSP